ncbi:hypothetical protein SNE510_07060 [Streptomyces sp. NE5-10]|nr:hypothetical protein SNE510_07060 [Streptomyces sp. NE5-10]
MDPSAVMAGDHFRRWRRSHPPRLTPGSGPRRAGSTDGTASFHDEGHTFDVRVPVGSTAPEPVVHSTVLKVVSDVRRRVSGVPYGRSTVPVVG